ncbi:MAG: phospholipase [Bdellovibrio sp. CG10_big_fil_rev_8_21_14_0_10_47_8]|nr:MAG: phospholipase [Bdellovibrio sp. CG10_big_fil_rev_8_21_14_0_10_47_8]
MTPRFFYFVICILALFASTSCTSIFYYPRIPDRKFYDPKQAGLIQEEIYFEDEDHHRLHGWWFQATKEPNLGTLVFFHGNAENITTHFLQFTWLPAKGYSYFIFDYPGYGESQGGPSPKTNLMAGKAALQWVHQNKDARPLIVYGQSLGGNIALKTVLELRDHVPLRNLILDSTFLSYRSVARTKASEHWLTWLFQPLAWLVMSDSYAPEHIERVSPIPALVIHGQKDLVIDPKFGEEIYEKLAEPKEIWRIESGTHGNVFWTDGQSYRQKFIDYLARPKTVL